MDDEFAMIAALSLAFMAWMGGSFWRN